MWYSHGMPTTATAPHELDPIETHPAKYSDGIIAEIARCLRKYVPPGDIVLDPFAGIGGIHVFAPEWDTRGIELEPEWANCHHRTTIGTALALPYDDGEVGAVATSPCYGNRMADTYLGAGDSCRACGGDGLNHGSGWTKRPCSICESPDHPRRDCPDRSTELIDLPCRSCGGSGKLRNPRATYAISLGRVPSEGSAAAMQWGPEYRQFHTDAWREAYRVLRPGGVLMVNMSDHVRKDELQPVTLWHATTLAGLGLSMVEAKAIDTKRMKHGANRDLRAQAEWLITFRK